MLHPTLWRRESPSVWDDMFNSRREFDRMFDRLVSRAGASVSAGWTPVVDIRETTEVLQVVAELPGLEPENVSVSVEDGVLTIAGDKQHERIEGEDEAEYHLVERNYGRFERRFTLPRTVDSEKINAAFAEGVLTVILPKTEAAKPRRIEVKAGEAKGIK